MLRAYWKAEFTNFLVFDLTQPGLEPTIYHIRDKHPSDLSFFLHHDLHRTVQG